MRCLEVHNAKGRLTGRLKGRRCLEGHETKGRLTGRAGILTGRGAVEDSRTWLLLFSCLVNGFRTAGCTDAQTAVMLRQV